MAVAFDAKTSAVTESSSATSINVSNLTVGSGSNRAMAAVISWAKGTSPASVVATWDSGGTNQAMTLISGTQSANGTSSIATAMYGLIAPTSGNKTLAISWTGALEVHAEAISFTGVDQTSVAVAFPHGAATNQTANTASPSSITITSATGNMVVAGHTNAAVAWGAISDTTLASSSALFLIAAGNYAAGAASNTLTAAFTGGSVPWAAFGCDVLAASVVATYTPYNPWPLAAPLLAQ